MLPLLLQPPSQLARGRRLARTLESEEQHDARRRRILRESAFRLAEQRQQLVAHDLDDLLDRRQALQDGLIGRLVANAIDERLDDLEVDVGFEQRQPDLPQRRLDVFRGQTHLAPK